MKRVEANDAVAMGSMLGSYYNHGQLDLQQDLNKAIELWTWAGQQILGCCSKAHISRPV